MTIAGHIIKLAATSAVGLVSGVLNNTVMRLVNGNKQLIRQQDSKTDGDMILNNLGIPDASYSGAMDMLWRMLSSHLGLALLGLILSRPKE